MQYCRLSEARIKGQLVKVSWATPFEKRKIRPRMSDEDRYRYVGAPHPFLSTSQTHFLGGGGGCFTATPLPATAAAAAASCDPRASH